MKTVPALVKKADDSLHAARLLATEGLYDFAVIHAYFAMHYAARAFLLSAEGLTVRQPEEVVEAFDQHFAQTGALPPIFYRWLRDAMELMRSAEYDPLTGFTTDDVAEQLDRGRAFVALGKEELTEQRP